MGREASGFDLTVGIAREFAVLAIECDQPALRVLPAVLVLGQRHHAGEIGLRQPLDLLAQPCTGTAQVGPPCLHLLWQPVPAARPLHCMRDHLRRGEHLAKVAPNQFLKGTAGDAARRAAFACRLRRGPRSRPADVVVVAPPHMPACAGLAAMTAADEATEEVFMNSVVPRRHSLIIGQPLLRALKLFSRNDGRHGRDRDPLGRIRQPPAVAGATGRPQGGAALLDGARAQAVAEDLAEVDRVVQHIAHGREVPTLETERRGDAQVV